MGRFVGTGDERTVVNKYIDSYLKGTNDYAKYLQSAPNFVTYYSRDHEHSTENSGLGDIEEVVGERSPLRYNRINNVPLYMVEDSAPDIMADGVLGMGYNVESSAVIIPNTVIPLPNDLFVFSYWEKSSQKEVLFRITNVTTTAADSNTYYQIQFQSTPYKNEDLESRQLVERYEVIYDHVASSKPAVIVERDYILAERIGKVFDSISSYYVDMYYDVNLNMFIMGSGYDDEGNVAKIFDACLHEFIREQMFFINSKTMVKNILLDKLVLRPDLKRCSPYYEVQRGGSLNVSFEYYTYVDRAIFKMFPDTFREIFYYKDPQNWLSLDPNLLDLYELVKNAEKGESLEGKINNFDFNRLEEETIAKAHIHMIPYISIPIMLYLLDKLGQILVRGNKYG